MRIENLKKKNKTNKTPTSRSLAYSESEGRKKKPKAQKRTIHNRPGSQVEEAKILPTLTPPSPSTPHPGQETQLTWGHRLSPHHSAPSHPSYLLFYKGAFKDSISHYF